MNRTHFIFVRQPTKKGHKTYLGMDRLQIGSYSDVPEPLLLAGLALEGNSASRSETAYCAFLDKLYNEGIKNYDLLSLKIQSGSDWEFLGYDVGETTSRYWSAVAHLDYFLTLQQIAVWEAKLNANGLFENMADAEAFLNIYLDSEDPDKGWSTDGWDEEPDWYAVIAIYRYVIF